MIKGENRVLQAFLGTLLTWGLTAAGSALVFVFTTGRFTGKRKILDGSLGFAAGVMTAASYWSLLAPALQMAQESGTYGENGAFAPVAIGFLLGGGFVLLSDMCLPRFTNEDPAVALAMHNQPKKRELEMTDTVTSNVDSAADEINGGSANLAGNRYGDNKDGNDTVSLSDSVQFKIRNRKTVQRDNEVVLEYEIEADKSSSSSAAAAAADEELKKRKQKFESWKRMLLLIIAITVHNIPEGLAVGVGFGAIGTTDSATFEKARSLAIGIGIQNFPEGMAVSIPLCAAGYSPLKSFWYGQLSGMVEPIFGVLGSLVVVVAEPILPYALAFAAGAMIFVVVDDLIPEANMCGNGRIASWGAMFGFVVMMSLDVALG